MAKFALIVDGKPYPMRVVGNMAWGGQQSVVIYEAPGSNSGTVLLTGTTTQKRTLNGRLLTNGTQTPNDAKTYLESVRDAGKIVTLVSPADESATGRYVISNFEGQVLEGIESYMPFSMELIQYRQADVKRARVNLVNVGPADRIRQLVAQRNIVPT